MSDYFDFPSAPVLDDEEAALEDDLNDETFGGAAEATDWEAEHERLAGLEDDGEFVEFAGLDDDDEGQREDSRGNNGDSLGAAAMRLPQGHLQAYQKQLEELQRQHQLQFQQQQAQFQQQHHQHHRKPPEQPAKVATPNLDGAADLDEFCPLEDLNAFCDRLVVDSDDELDDPSIITVSKNRPMRPRNSNSATYAPAAAAAAVGGGAVQPELQQLPPPPPLQMPPPTAWAAAMAANLSRLPTHQQQQAAAAAVAALGASGMTADPNALMRHLAMAATMAATKQQQQQQQPVLPPLFQQLLSSMNLGGQQQQQPSPQRLAALRALQQTQRMNAAAPMQQQQLQQQQQQQQLQQQFQQHQQQHRDPRLTHPMVQPKPNSLFSSFRRWPSEYDNFMTRRDKDTVIGIQSRVLEKEMEDPVTSDYYYITWRLKQARRSNPGIFPSMPIPVPRSAEDGQSDQPSGGDADASSGVGRRAAELRMSGTLGCLTTSSVHTPRQTIDIRRLASDAQTSPSEAPTAAPADTEHLRHLGLMLRIESLYCVYLRFDDCEKRYLTSSEPEKRHICVTERRKALEALCSGFFGDSELPLLLSVRKGRRLLKSVLNSCDKDLLFSALRTLLTSLPGLRQQQLEADGLTELSLAFSAAIRRLESNLVEELLSFALQAEPRSLFCHELPCHWFFDLLGRHAHFCLARSDPTGLRRLVDRVAAALAELPSDSLACIASALPTSSHLHGQLVDYLAPPVRLLAERKFTKILLPADS
ncbi:hypothetical protein BOX15_Mlig023329g2 [Macrostomum lignano]|uniref:mRNA decay factor PAT1 domain-containing protein n=2 Tax=Macrostomum lignano TaxID=282301 RepID=A0A267G7F4_9PLAT|nr:hypothetical protein BOX15_Mlig023329g2 [Macrostomum lignano]